MGSVLLIEDLRRWGTAGRAIGSANTCQWGQWWTISKDQRIIFKAAIYGVPGLCVCPPQHYLSSKGILHILLPLFCYREQMWAPLWESNKSWLRGLSLLVRKQAWKALAPFHRGGSSQEGDGWPGLTDSLVSQGVEFRFSLDRFKDDFATWWFCLNSKLLT